MVSSQPSTLTETLAQGPNLCPVKILLPMGPPDVVSSESVEYDFSDVFGSTPVQTPTNLCGHGPDSPALTADSNEEVYNDPVVIIKRSHSLVGPTSLVSRSLRLSKLSLGKTAGSSELAKCLSEEKEGEQGQLSDEEFDNATTEYEGVGLDDFEILKLVGQGAFGKVFQVRKKNTSEIYAMKVMRKDKILENNHAEYMKAEREILTKVDHSFIVQLRYSFQTKYRLYLVLDFVNGGHLFFQLYKQGLFREELARIYTAEIVSAVAHLHANGIMHRDLKPENILLDADGHVRIPYNRHLRRLLNLLTSLPLPCISRPCSLTLALQRNSVKILDQTRCVALLSTWPQKLFLVGGMIRLRTGGVWESSCLKCLRAR
jgi:p70 ribosomal S6 kinase